MRRTHDTFADKAARFAYAMTIQDPIECTQGHVNGCAWTAIGIIPFGKVGKIGKLAAIGLTDEAATTAANTGPDLAQGFRSFSQAKRSLPSPGQGNVYDHVVEQSQIAASRSGFDPRLIHNPANLNPVPAAVNQAKANYYSSIRPFTGGQAVRNWLNGQTFGQQHSFGMDITSLIQRGGSLP